MATNEYGMSLTTGAAGTSARVIMSDPKTFLIRPATDMNL